jgi:hypothetical protein
MAVSYAPIPVVHESIDGAAGCDPFRSFVAVPSGGRVNQKAVARTGPAPTGHRCCDSAESPQEYAY